MCVLSHVQATADFLRQRVVQVETVAPAAAPTASAEHRESCRRRRCFSVLRTNAMHAVLKVNKNTMVGEFMTISQAKERAVHDAKRDAQRRAQGLAPFVDCGRGSDCCGGRCEESTRKTVN